jgi:RsiW-degrading membrane proteinase PrsW (M82 family)
MRAPAVVMLFLIVGLGFLGGAALDVWAPPGDPAWWKANALRDAGEHQQAHAAYLGHAEQQGGRLEFLADVLRNHQQWQAVAVGRARVAIPPVTALEARFRATALPGEVELLPHLTGFVSHAQQPEARLEALRELAARRPHVAWANRLLGAALEQRGETALAVDHYVEEGRSVVDHREDLDHAAHLLMRQGMWERAQDLSVMPGVREGLSAAVFYRLAVHARDWPLVARLFLEAHFPSPEPFAVVLAGLAALAWLLFLLRLGQVAQRPRHRLVLALLAFGLGVLSVAPTMVFITWQEEVGRLRLTGNPGPDALYFVIGVGLREELAKLLCAVPLVFLLGRQRTRLEVLTAGALVGLGFAAEENLGYLSHGGTMAALVRYLTANAFHIMLTGNCLLAVHDAVKDFEKRSLDASLTVLRQVLFHGAYDFFLTHDVGGGGMIHLVPFFLAAREFFGSVGEARDSRRDALELREFFILCLAAVTAVTYAYACMYVGPSAAAVQVAGGALGLALVAILFMREMARL